MVEAVNTIKYNQTGNFDANQCQGGALSNLGYSLASGAESVFRGIGSVAGSLGNSLMQAGAQLSSIPAPAVAFGWGWGPWCWGPWGVPGIGIYGYPMYFGPLTNIGISDTSFGGTSCSCKFNCGSSGGASGGLSTYDSSASPMAMANAAMDISGINTNINTPQSVVPIYNPGSVTEAFMGIDRAMNPGKYNSDGTPKTTGNGGLNTNEAKNKPLELVDAEGKIVTPRWYKKIANKVDQKQQLTSEEKAVYQKYNEIRRKYSPYLLDENFDIKTDMNGQPVESSFYAEIEQLQHFINRKNRNQIEAYINSCSPEKLAALELYYPTVLKKITGGVSLREALKDACIVSWMEWSGWNTDRCKRIFDKLDEAAMVTPTNMHCALEQALERHRVGGFGFDDDRLCKLLRKLETNKLFRNYVKDEYPGFIGTADDKWFKSEEAERLLNKIFN